MNKFKVKKHWYIVMTLVVSVFMFNSCDEDEEEVTPATPVVLEDIVVIPKRSQDTIIIGQSVTYEFGADSLDNKVAYSWNFVGGMPDASSDFGPTISYAEVGKYGASLTIKRIADGKEFSGEIATSLVVLDTMLASFAADRRVVDEGGIVNFMSTGNPDAELSWAFAGGSPTTATAADVAVTYNTPGMYDVSLTATLNGEVESNIEVDYIEVKAIEASFTSTTATINEGQTVTFTNTSTDGATLAWTFTGGDITTSTAEEVTVTYATAGTYNVSLAVTKNNITRTVTENDFVTVTVSAPLAATLVSAETSVDGTQVILEYDQPLQNPSGETIAVKVDTAMPVNASPVALDPADNMKIVATLPTAVTAGQTVTVTYSPTITTTTGGSVTALTDQAVTNNVPAPPMNLFANGVFEGIDSSVPGRFYGTAGGFQGSDPNGHITISIDPNVGVGNSSAMVFNFAATSVDTDNRSAFGDGMNPDPMGRVIQMIEPIEDGVTYEFKAMVKYTGALPGFLRFSITSLPFSDGGIVGQDINTSSLVSGSFVEVTGEFTANANTAGGNASGAGTGGVAYPLIRVGSVTGTSEVIIDNIEVFRK